MVGKPVIKGTRLTVDFIADLLANGWTGKQIMEHYPRMTHEDILACLSFANELVRLEKEAFIPELSIEALDIAVLHWLARFDEVQLNLM